MEQDNDFCGQRVVSLCFKCKGPQGGGGKKVRVGRTTRWGGGGGMFE